MKTDITVVAEYRKATLRAAASTEGGAAAREGKKWASMS